MKSLQIEGCLIKGFKNGEIESLVHCSNCQCTMGSGVARTIRENFPEAYEADCQTVKGSFEKLGTFSVARNNLGYIFNLYGQFDYGPLPKQYLNYEAFEKGLELIKKYCELNDIKSIGFPNRCGCDRAGGDWYIVSKMIDSAFENSEIEVKIYKL
jgi:O-acetyl-ADP-ribose deacetylase (regulator of RNase III)